jgi:hypothetical protein
MEIMLFGKTEAMLSGKAISLEAVAVAVAVAHNHRGKGHENQEIDEEGAKSWQISKIQILQR